MRQKSETPKSTSEQVVKNIRRATRKHHLAEAKIRVVLDGPRGEYSIAATPDSNPIVAQLSSRLSRYSATKPDNAVPPAMAARAHLRPSRDHAT